MPTIQQQINQLKKDKENLNTMLNTMGVETTGNETFTQLTPLVGKIVTDPILQDKVIEINDEWTINIKPDEGYDGLSSLLITVNQNNPINKYQMIEYIKGTSNDKKVNYFKTGIYPTNKTAIEIQYSFYNVNNNYSNLYGSSRLFLTQTTTSVDTRLIGLWNNELTGNIGDNYDYSKHTLKQDKNKTYFDGTLKKTFTDVEWKDENELLLFGYPGGNDCSAILYYCKIWEDDVLVRDFVPCYRKPDGAVGLFEKVENKFYENDGNVPFEKGADITA